MSWTDLPKEFSARTKNHVICLPQIHGETGFDIREDKELYRMNTRGHCEEIHPN